MYKSILLSAAFIVTSLISVSAQNVAINTTGVIANPSAMLDVSATNMGLLIPRVALTATNAAAPITTPATSLLVYNTATASTGTTSVSPGFYYWDGAQWVRVLNNGNAWNTQGNYGTTPATNFLGTIDNQSLVFRTNNTERMRILNTGNVGIGTSTPGYTLDLNNGTFGFGSSNQRTETRNDAGLQGSAGAQSGFYETSTPTANYPTGATSWWHLIDSRHSNTGNNYAMQFSGSFFDQDLYFRKTNGNGAQAWTRILTGSYLNANQYFDYGTGQVTTNGAWQYLPGMARTVNLNAGDKLVLFAYGGMMANGTVYSSSDIAIFVNGAPLADGGYTKVTVDYAGVRYLLHQNWSIFGHYVAPTTGSYTITVAAIQTAPSSGSSFIGGNGTSVLQGCLFTEVVKP